MKEHTRLTPINRFRERMLRWTNDTESGRRFAYWLGKVTGRLQFRLLKVHPADEIPWTPPKRPLAHATVALVTTSGVHLCTEKPFDLESDATFRSIPRSAKSADLCISHQRYDRRDAAEDLNLVFPLERLLELEAEGVIGRVAGIHYGFGFIHDLKDILEPGRQVGSRLSQAHVDLVLLVPA